MTWIVVRYPCLPEDEGMTHLLISIKTKEDAEKFVENYIKDGYFSRGNLGIVEVKDVI